MSVDPSIHIRCLGRPKTNPEEEERKHRPGRSSPLTIIPYPSNGNLPINMLPFLDTKDSWGLAQRSFLSKQILGLVDTKEDMTKGELPIPSTFSLLAKTSTPPHSMHSPAHP